MKKCLNYSFCLEHSHQTIKIRVGGFLNIKSIKSGCEWRREKMLLFIFIFGGDTVHPQYFLIYIESGCEWRREKI
ncbi:hypothetical protein Hanom_Chr01g00004861 [Helianthus anomalus]